MAVQSVQAAGLPRTRGVRLGEGGGLQGSGLGWRRGAAAIPGFASGVVELTDLFSKERVELTDVSFFPFYLEYLCYPV